MVIELIISGVVVVGTYIVAAATNSNPYEITVPEEKEQLSVPQRLRRAQQALFRKEHELGGIEAQLGHQAQKLEIANDLLDLGEKDLQVNTHILQQQEDALNITFREKNLDLHLIA